jgi:hypothetical protein
MLRFMGAGALLLVMASTVSAGERYIEIWNPPEARLAQPSTGCRQSSGCKPAAPSRHSPKATPRRVADAAAKSPAPRRAVAERARKQASPQAVELPRIITPEGNVLRVNDSEARVRVVR